VKSVRSRILVGQKRTFRTHVCCLVVYVDTSEERASEITAICCEDFEQIGVLPCQGCVIYHGRLESSSSMGMNRTSSPRGPEAVVQVQVQVGSEMELHSAASVIGTMRRRGVGSRSCWARKYLISKTVTVTVIVLTGEKRGNVTGTESAV
jgi:hypothetical protein